MIEASSLSMSPVTAATATPSVSAVGADRSNVERFDRAFLGVQEPPALQQAAPIENRSMGDVILEGLSRFKSDYDVRADRVASSLEAMNEKPLDMQQAMKLQYEIMQMTLEQDLTSKIADKTSQGVQTLFRNQG
jgi:type III secretion system YscI/HrpB-like protein